jgi:ElaB/YqjD/DUF883 family membrane-anchored ribosome-binding protein
MNPKETVQIVRSIRNDIDTMLTYYGELSDEMFYELSERIESNLKKIQDNAQKEWEKEIDSL